VVLGCFLGVFGGLKSEWREKMDGISTGNWRGMKKNKKMKGRKGEGKRRM
jgi:hypothetical protein